MRKRWVQHYPKEIPVNIEMNAQSLPYYLKKAAQESPKSKALHFIGKEISYKLLHDYVVRFAAYIQALGLKQGDRVAVMLPNCPQAVIGYYGVLLAGGIVVQTNPLYTERELIYQLNDSGAKMIICLDLSYPQVSTAKEKTSLEHIIVTGIKDFLPFPKNLLYPFTQRKENKLIVQVNHSGNNHLLTEVLKYPRSNLQDIEVDTNDVAILQYTGGTTGQPKGVMLTHRNLVLNTSMAAKWLYQTERGKEIVLGALPFFHAYGMTTVMNLAMMEGHKMILLPRFHVEDVLKVIEKHRPTLFPGAPTMYIALLNHPNLGNYDLSSIKACLSGSAALPREVQEKFEKITGGKLVEGYGLTEASPITHCNLIWGERVNGSIGLPWPDTDAKIISLETGEEVAINEIGELIVKGPQVMKGYWNRPEETETVLKDGWLHTGDMGYMDEEGYFYIVDRKKDMIIAGGFNIYPREIEEVLYENEKIKEAVVVGIPHEYRGETVKAFVVLKDGVTCTEEELDQFARKYLAAYKVPRLYEFREELPKSIIGKVLRRLLLEEELEKHA